MDLPCDNCIVHPCCTSKCYDYLNYVMNHNIINITCIGDDRETFLIAETGETFKSPVKMEVNV